MVLVYWYESLSGQLLRWYCYQDVLCAKKFFVPRYIFCAKISFLWPRISSCFTKCCHTRFSPGYPHRPNLGQGTKATGASISDFQTNTRVEKLQPGALEYAVELFTQLHCVAASSSKPVCSAFQCTVQCKKLFPVHCSLYKTVSSALFSVNKTVYCKASNFLCVGRQSLQSYNDFINW